MLRAAPVFGMLAWCGSLLPMAIALTGVVFAGIWMHRKSRRDQTLIELLVMIQDTSREIDDLLAETPRAERRDHQQEE